MFGLLTFLASRYVWVGARNDGGEIGASKDQDMNVPNFRRARPTDWPEIRLLLLTCSLPLEGAKDHIASFLVAHDEAGLVACGGLEIYGSDALLRSVAVSERYRNRRLGRELIARLCTLAADEDVQMLVLLTDTAEPYFRRLGFEAVPRTALPASVTVSAEFRGACPASAIAMRKSLQPN
jgi:amino-acid N-acetyltransferase